jgi:hypothetical protein
MAEEHIATYLNDHLAGAIAAIELLEHLEAAHASTSLAAFLVELRTHIVADRQELEALLGQLQVAESRTRKGQLGWARKLPNSNYGWTIRQEDLCACSKHLRLWQLGSKGNERYGEPWQRRLRIHPGFESLTMNAWSGGRRSTPTSGGEATGGC